MAVRGPRARPARPGCRTTSPARTSCSTSSTRSPSSSPTASAPTRTAARTSSAPTTSPSSARSIADQRRGARRHRRAVAPAHPAAVRRGLPRRARRHLAEEDAEPIRRARRPGVDPGRRAAARRGRRTARRGRQRRARPPPRPSAQEQIAYAQGVLELSVRARETYEFEDEEESEVLAAHDIIDAERMAERHEEADHRSAAERAAADRTWAFGHIIVDEAQELSAMAWRLLMRRCPTRSMTLVGDPAQTAEAAGVGSWERHPRRRTSATAGSTSGWGSTTARPPRSWRWRPACVRADGPGLRAARARCGRPA